MTRRTLPQVGVIAVLALALVAGTLGVARGMGQKASSIPAPAVIHWANEGVSDLVTLDPVRGPDYNAMLAVRLIFGGLVRFGPDFSILPDAATRWEISPDGRTYTFHLRPHLRFGDGTPLTAADVAYSLNRTLSPRFSSQSGAYLLGDIAGAEAVSSGYAARASGIDVLDARTLRIRLLRPSGSFLSKLATFAGYIVPPRRVAADPAHWDRRALGTGPFMVGRWIPNNALLLVANPYYAGGPLHIQGIDMPFVPEPLTAYKRYRAGALDVMGSIQFPAQALYDVQDQSEFHQSARLETVYLTLNTRKAPLNDTRVRLALAQAVDRSALVRDVYGGFAHPARGMLPPGLRGYSPHLRVPGHDPTRARRLLAAAGYPGGRGLPQLTYAVDQDAQSMLLASALAAQWRSVLGIQIHLVQHDHNSFLDLLTRHRYDLAVIDWTVDYPDPQNFLSQLLHSNVPNNNGAWHDATFDRLVDTADAMSGDAPVRLALYRRAEELAMGRAAAIPLVNPLSGILLSAQIHGLQINGGQIMAADWAAVTVSRGTGT